MANRISFCSQEIRKKKPRGGGIKAAAGGIYQGAWKNGTPMKRTGGEDTPYNFGPGCRRVAEVLEGEESVGKSGFFAKVGKKTEIRAKQGLRKKLFRRGSWEEGEGRVLQPHKLLSNGRKALIAKELPSGATRQRRFERKRRGGLNGRGVISRAY